MNCKEFKEKLSDESFSDFNILEQHIKECPKCANLLEKSIEETPQGLEKPILETPGKKAVPEFPEDKEENKTFWSVYFEGLQYGFVFGLAIVVGFALLPYFNGQTSTNKVTEKMPTFASLSFVEDANVSQLSFYEENQMDFLEKNNFSVTFLENEDSQLVNFIETEPMTSFIEENQEEIL